MYTKLKENENINYNFTINGLEYTTLKKSSIDDRIALEGAYPFLLKDYNSTINSVTEGESVHFSSVSGQYDRPTNDDLIQQWIDKHQLNYGKKPILRHQYNSNFILDDLLNTNIDIVNVLNSVDISLYKDKATLIAEDSNYRNDNTNVDSVYYPMDLYKVHTVGDDEFDGNSDNILLDKFSITLSEDFIMDRWDNRRLLDFDATLVVNPITLENYRTFCWNGLIDTNEYDSITNAENIEYEWTDILEKYDESNKPLPNEYYKDVYLVNGGHKYSNYKVDTNNVSYHIDFNRYFLKLYNKRYLIKEENTLVLSDLNDNEKYLLSKKLLSTDFSRSHFVNENNLIDVYENIDNVHFVDVVALSDIPKNDVNEVILKSDFRLNVNDINNDYNSIGLSDLSEIDKTVNIDIHFLKVLFKSINTFKLKIASEEYTIRFDAQNGLLTDFDNDYLNLTYNTYKKSGNNVYEFILRAKNPNTPVLNISIYCETNVFEIQTNKSPKLISTNYKEELKLYNTKFNYYEIFGNLPENPQPSMDFVIEKLIGYQSWN